MAIHAPCEIEYTCSKPFNKSLEISSLKSEQMFTT